MKKIIYDIGANNGDDVAYYLKKCDVVVAVEANPLLCRQIEQRFPAAIKNESLIVINCVVTTDSTQSEVVFYIHKTNHVLSQFPPPTDDSLGEFEKVILPSQSILAIVQRHGSPLYVKIDIENYDKKILRALFEEGIRPAFISAETYTIDIFSLMLTLGQYKSFNLIDAPNVSRTFRNHKILVNGKTEDYSFLHHSSGPFGEDIPSPWMTPDQFFAFLALEGLGWKDIHATNAITPTANLLPPKPAAYMLKALRQKIKKILGRFFPA